MDSKSHARSLTAPNEAVRLLVAVENSMYCQLLTSALRRSRALCIVARVTTSDGLIRDVATSCPNVALISANLQNGVSLGFAAVRELYKSHPEVRTILLLDSAEPTVVIDAFRAGVKGIFCRDDSLKLLCKCVQKVHAGQIWANSRQLEIVLEAFGRVVPPSIVEPNGMPLLSRRERQVAALVAAGLSNREISKQLQLSEHTIKNYLFHIFEKLGISSRVELVLYARDRERNALGLDFSGPVEAEERLPSA